VIDLVVRFGIANLGVALAIALVAWGVQRGGGRPGLAHALWLLVLLKLVTPPLWSVDVPRLGAGAAGESVALVSGTSGAPVRSEPATASAPTRGAPLDGRSLAEPLLAWLFGLLLAGALFVLAVSLRRIARFRRLLREAATAPPPALSDTARELAARFGLARPPELVVVRASLSPSVWWAGGRARIVLPEALLRDADERELRCIVAHEIAHVRRRDHVVRWLEWAVCVAFWWNPLAWWARRNLRINEEQCCDALVLARLDASPHTYASALLRALELLAAPSVRPPAVVSALDNGGALEERLTMILSRRPLLATPRWLSAGILVSAAGLLPLGVAHPQVERAKTEQAADAAAEKAEIKRLARELKEELAAGKVTKVEAEARLIELKARVAAGAAPARKALTKKAYAAKLAELERKVAAGELTREEWKRKTAELRALTTERKPSIALEDLAQVQAKLRRAVADGHLTQAEADAKLAALKREIVRAETAKKLSKEERAVLEIKAAIEAGKLSPEDGRAAIEQVLAQARSAAAKRELEAARARELERAAHELKQAAAEGRMSRAELEQRLVELKRKAGKRQPAQEGK